MIEQKIKTGGRKKGEPNKSTKLIRDKFQSVLDTIDVDSINKDLELLKPIDRLKMIISLSEYIAPKYQRLVVSDEKDLNKEPPLFPDILC